MIDHTLIVDQLLTPDECRALIAESQAAGLKKDSEHTHYGYSHRDYTIEDNFTHPILSRVNQFMLATYVKEFPNLLHMDNDILWTAWRFKHFAPGDAFGHWHCEHNLKIPHRILCCMLYLSDNQCGTEFMHYDTTIGSVQGRAIMFPTFFTHVHRGQPDPNGQDRYIMSNYLYMGSKPMAKPIVI
jgi:hypothetical protein